MLHPCPTAGKWPRVSRCRRLLLRLRPRPCCSPGCCSCKSSSCALQEGFGVSGRATAAVRLSMPLLLCTADVADSAFCVRVVVWAVVVAGPIPTVIGAAVAASFASGLSAFLVHVAVNWPRSAFLCSLFVCVVLLLPSFVSRDVSQSICVRNRFPLLLVCRTQEESIG